MKKCIMCGGSLPPKRSKYCSKPCERRKRAEDAMQVRIDNGDPTAGLGKGGSNLKGKNHKQYNSGMGKFYRHRKEMRKTITNCERCFVDLTNATRYEWCVHHRDHNRANNKRKNLEMLCKRCHQVHHDCVDALNN